jgi:uncharacterized integral membrane protein
MERLSHWLAWTAVAVIVMFAGLNWSALTAITSLNLLVAQVQAPMGVVLLGLTAVFVALFFMATLYSRVANLVESRGLLKKLRLAQEMADKAEASRLENLQQVMLAEFRKLSERIDKLEVTPTPLVRLP